MRPIKESTYNAIKSRNLIGPNAFKHRVMIEGASGPPPPDDPPGTILISTAEELYNVRNNLSGSYRQTRDIDLSIYENWEPIGGFPLGQWWRRDLDEVCLTAFRGTYNGGGYTIRNLRIESEDDYADGIALFGYVQLGNVKNVKLENVFIKHTGRVTCIGALAGMITASNIENCSSSGSIQLDAQSYVGGLIGYIEGGESLEAGKHKVESSNSSIDITKLVDSLDADHGINNWLDDVGGLIGFVEDMDSLVEVLNCYATGDILVEDYLTGSHMGHKHGQYNIGGFIGYTDGATFDQCYSTGTVQGMSTTGGFMGQGDNFTTRNCYSTSDIIFDYRYLIIAQDSEDSCGDFGGFAGGRVYNATLSNCYATGVIPVGNFYNNSGFMQGRSDDNLNIISCFYNSDNAQGFEDVATPKTTAELKTKSTFVGWDFDTIWDIKSTHNNGYPIFAETGLPNFDVMSIFKISSISISKSHGGASTATIEVDNKNGMVNPRNQDGPLYKILNLNRQIIIEQGYGDDVVPSFTGIIDGIDMRTFPQVATISLRDNFKKALDQTITKAGKNVVNYTNQPIENIVTDLCVLCGLTIGYIEPTGITIEKEFSWQSYADAFQFLSDIASFEYLCDETGKFHFRRDFQPGNMSVAWSFEEGIDITNMSYKLDDNDLYSAVRVYGSSGDNILVYNAPFLDAAQFNILPQKVLKIDATEASTVNELRKIAERAIATMRSRTRVINFTAIAVPHLQSGDFIQIFENSTDTHEIYRLTSINLNMDNKKFTMNCTAYYYGDSIVPEELPDTTGTQSIDPNLNLIPEMTSNTAPSGVARASSVYKDWQATYSPWRSLNGNDQDFFWDANTKVAWLEYEFPQKMIVDKYVLRARELILYNKAMPKDFTFEAFNGEKWIVLDTRTNQVDWQIYEERAFKFTNTTAYAKYRINITRNNGYTRTQFERLKMYYGGGA